MGTPVIVGAIPARYASERLPGKPLRLIAGKPMIQHVYERALAAPGLERVVVLTDDGRIAETVASFGGLVEMTPVDCASGTDRIAWSAREWTDADGVVNIQGDEPLVEPAAIDRIAHQLRDTNDQMVTLATGATAADLGNPNAVKVVCDAANFALYFSRARIPYSRRLEGAPVLRHIGLYGYRRETLLRLATLEPTPLERAESLEQLRALEHAIRIRVLLVDSAAPGVDTVEDLEAVEKMLLARTIHQPLLPPLRPR